MPAPASAPADRFAAIMDALCRAMAAEANARRVAGPLVLLIWVRLRRLAARFTLTLHAPPARTHRPARPDRPTHERRQILPRHFGWLRRLLPGVSGAASQLNHLLSGPEMAALIAASPATGRTLRPLCHLLGLRPPPALRLPRRAAVSVPPRPTAPEPARKSGPAPARPRPPAGADPRNPSAPAWSRRRKTYTPAPYTRPIRA